MGAPKQRWTEEEEAALKAGILKHGLGKWRIISKDPEFSSILCLRSNVDLKDKWRNMNVTAQYGSRRLAGRKTQEIVKLDENPLAITEVVQIDEDILDVKPLDTINGPSQLSASKKSIPRLDNLVLEAITSLKEPTGSKRTNIAMYIEKEEMIFQMAIGFQGSILCTSTFPKDLVSKVKGFDSKWKIDQDGSDHLGGHISATKVSLTSCTQQNLSFGTSRAWTKVRMVLYVTVNIGLVKAASAGRQNDRPIHL
ncbi:hypothetical protein IFM89_016668 [Coptis chinensis]|uniref:MYB transcription factor n=1 Tax=Coptis chinensis TaxID=261450 RepID=A0A835MBQ9_9MAGN|nr:hypothetical protein IFM89_016668 [Coptis chinensis]